MRLTFFEIGLFIALPLTLLSATLGATVAHAHPALETAGMVLRGVSVLGYAIFCAFAVWRKSRPHVHFKYMTSHAIAVGWTEPNFHVSKDHFCILVEEYLTKAEVVFPGARLAVKGTIVIFREPVWYYRKTRVRGLQDHHVISVGWHPNLNETALKHELGHRILQVLVGDPPEADAHRLLELNGLL